MKKTIVIAFILLAAGQAFAQKAYVDPSQRQSNGLLEEAPAPTAPAVKKATNTPVKKKLTRKQKRTIKVCNCRSLMAMSIYTERLCEAAQKKQLTDDSCLKYKFYSSSYYNKAKKATVRLADKYDIDWEEACEDAAEEYPREQKYSKMKKVLKKWHRNKCDTDVILSM